MMMRQPSPRSLLALVLPIALALAAVGLLADRSPLGQEPVAAATQPTESLVNFETPHVHPIDLTPDGRTLLVVNTAAARLEVFDVSSGRPVAVASIPVGLDPVSVRARDDGEAWVVNHLSDSLSVVDLASKAVVDTKQTSNEPADVVFAGNPQRAYVSASEANRVEVFDPDSPADDPIASASIAGEDPRALAVSPDGRFVYAAIFESGNRTTIVPGHDTQLATNVVSRPEGPYGGVNPPPNSGNSFSPPIAPGAGPGAETSMIVREDDAGRWLDDNGRDWSLFIDGPLAGLSQRVQGWELADHDVAVIDTDSLAVSYQDHLMNLNMAIGVNPANGRITTVGTDASNEVRFEPNLNGRFVTVAIADFARGGSASVADLNPHLDYSTPTVDPSVRAQSVGDPRGIAWTADGSRAYVTGMGSNNVIVTDGAGNRLGRLDVGEGPTGIVLDDGANRGYVLNKFSGSISVIDTASDRVTDEVAFYDPTPDVIKQGRPLLYDTQLTSGTGHLSCASCHVDARTDRLAWDLGDPEGTPARVPENNGAGGLTGRTVSVSPMKGVMLTQTLQDITDFGSLHWRGDRGELADFNATFVNLMGRPSEISDQEMDRFEAFLATIHLPPNPYRRIDNSRPSTVTLPTGETVSSGSNTALNACISCHYGGSERPAGVNIELGQAFVPQSWAPWYDRLGYWPGDVAGSTTGFGYFHDGSATLDRAAREDRFLTEILTLEGPGGLLTGGETRSDVHAGVGQQLTIEGSPDAGERARLDQLVAIADGGSTVSMIAASSEAGATTGFRYDGNGAWTGDRAGLTATTATLLATAGDGHPVTFTVVANGTQTRLGIDLDDDGVGNGDEPPPDPVGIDGTVTRVGGAPVADVGVELFTALGDGSRGSWLSSTATGADGRYRLVPPQDGCWVVTFVAAAGDRFVDGGTRWLNRFVCLVDGRATVDATLAGDQPSPSTIDGSVVDQVGGVDGVAVDLFTSNPAGDRLGWVTSVRTDSDGSFSFTVDPGCWVLTYIAPDPARFDNGSAFLNRALCLDPGQSAQVPPVTLVVDRSDAEVSGTVVAADGPVAGVAVDLFTAGGDGSRATYLTTGTTDPTGRYGFAPVAGCYVEVLIAPVGRTWTLSGGIYLERAFCVASGEVRTQPEAQLQP